MQKIKITNINSEEMCGTWYENMVNKIFLVDYKCDQYFFIDMNKSKIKNTHLFVHERHCKIIKTKAERLRRPVEQSETPWYRKQKFFHGF